MILHCTQNEAAAHTTSIKAIEFYIVEMVRTCVQTRINPQQFSATLFVYDFGGHAVWMIAESLERLSRLHAQQCVGVL